MLRATPCLCALPLEFDRGACARCGRWLTTDLDGPTGLADGWLALDIAVDRTVDDLREDAWMVGAPVTDRRAYLAWLEAQLAALELRDYVAAADKNRAARSPVGV